MRYRWLLCLFACLLAAPVTAATLVQSTLAVGPGGQDAISLAYTSNVTGGSALVVACSVYLTSGFSAANPTLSDTLGNTWTVRVNQGISDIDSLRDRLYIGTAITAAGGANTITCNPPGSSAYITLVILEVSGINQGAPVDQTASCGTACGGGATVLSGTTGITAQADEFIVGAMIYSHPTLQTITANAPCTVVQENEDYNFEVIAVCSHIVSSTGAQAVSWAINNTDAYKAAGIITLRIAAAAGTSPGGLVVVFP